VPYLSALEVSLREGAIQIQVYLTLTYQYHSACSNVSRVLQVRCLLLLSAVKSWKLRLRWRRDTRKRLTGYEYCWKALQVLCRYAVFW